MSPVVPLPPASPSSTGGEQSIFATMRLIESSAEYTDCDGGCDDGNIDNY